ncbi:glycoside hydrolase domain-containing protein [Paenibacillus agaridevorans]|uniref:glycoside hydrolase domain-containing protein n=1 Tax=Paenibacillus agaridevorans TaxID=171404 RepID=UPI0015E825BE|nr:glycoside hydrolase domain-containing protein [Paenibacillus agaridevorans]
MQAPPNAVAATLLLYQNASNKGVAYYDEASLVIEPAIHDFASLNELSRSDGLEIVPVDQALLFKVVQPGQFAEYEFPVTGTGLFDLRLEGISSPLGGQAEVFLDGASIGQMDFFGQGNDVIEFKAALSLSAGLHTIKLVSTGKHTDSGGFDLTLKQLKVFLDLTAQLLQEVNSKLDSGLVLLEAADSKLLPGNAAEDQYLRQQSAELANRIQVMRDIAEQPDIEYEAAKALIIDADALAWEIKRFANFTEVRQARPNGKFGIATSDSMSLVYPIDLPCQCSSAPASLSLAQGEYENIQAVVMPYGESLNNVGAQIAAVTGPDDQPVSQSLLAVTAAPVGSVNVKPSSLYTLPGLVNSPDNYYGWIPDPIRSDLSSVDIPVGTMQSFWLEFYADKQLEPGTYQVAIDFQAEGAEPQTLNVSIKVWPFEIEDRPLLPTSLTTNPLNILDVYGLSNEDQKAQMYEKYVDFLETFKIEPDNIYRSTPPTVEELLALQSKWGLKQFNITYIDPRTFDLAQPATWQPKIDQIIQTIGDAMTEYEAAGLADKAYVYGFDETRDQYFPIVLNILQQLKASFPNLPIMSTIFDDSLGTNTGFADYIDIWVPGVHKINEGVKNAAQQRGDQVYWYIHAGVKQPYPNWFNGYSPSDTRVLLGPLSHKKEVDGFLYYNINRWLGRAPMSDDILSSWDPRTYANADGDGSLYYPGPDGPLASQRIQNFRDGMEDYNLLDLLKSRISDAQGDHVSVDLLSDAQELLNANTVAVSQTNYTKDPVLYRQWRESVAAMIVMLSTDTGEGSSIAAPTNLIVHPVSEARLDLSWTASESEEVVGYKIYRDGVEIGASTTTTFIDNLELMPGTTYTYTVRAHDAEALLSDESNAVQGTTLMATGGMSGRLSGPAQVFLNREFVLKFGIQGLVDGTHEEVKAIDLTIHYDPNLLEWKGVSPLIEGLTIIPQESPTAGTMRILGVKIGDVVNANSDWLELQFKSKSSAGQGQIMVDQITISNPDGDELGLNPASAQVAIMSYDLNGNGSISIGDLAILAAAYGSVAGDSNWNPAADMNVDGVIDLDDLVFLASLLLG